MFYVPLPFDSAKLEAVEAAAKATRAMIALVAILKDLSAGQLDAKAAKIRVQNEIRQLRKDCGDEKNHCRRPS